MNYHLHWQGLLLLGPERPVEIMVLRGYLLLPSPPSKGSPLAEACMQCWTGPSLLRREGAPLWAVF